MHVFYAGALLEFVYVLTATIRCKDGKLMFFEILTLNNVFVDVGIFYNAMNCKVLLLILKYLTSLNCKVFFPY